MAARLAVTLKLLLTVVPMAVTARTRLSERLVCPDVPRDPGVCSREGVYVACTEKSTADDYRCYCDAAGLPMPCAEACRSPFLGDYGYGPECQQSCAEYLVKECQPVRDGAVIYGGESNGYGIPPVEHWIWLTAVISIILVVAIMVLWCCCCCKSGPCHLSLNCPNIVAVEENRSPRQETQRTSLFPISRWRWFGWHDRTIMVEATSKVSLMAETD